MFSAKILLTNIDMVGRFITKRGAAKLRLLSLVFLATASLVYRLSVAMTSIGFFSDGIAVLSPQRSDDVACCLGGHIHGV